MAPTILIVGATGNTGKSVVETLPGLLRGNKNLAGHRILALTRSLASPACQKLAQVQGVEWMEQNWVEITADWLRKQNVVRVFVASHNGPRQFIEESQFYVNALHAGVQYVVRISTTAANVTPVNPAFYPRCHWAIEHMLSQPEFKELQWTSLQPNLFSPDVVAFAADFIKKYRKTGEQGTIGMILDADSPIGLIHPNDVGIFASHLLSQDKTLEHNQARYVMNGPGDVTGKQIIELVEQHIGAKVKNVKYKDMSFAEQWAEHTSGSKNLASALIDAVASIWEGKFTVATTSKKVLELAPPTISVADTLKTLCLEA